jgi:integrase
MGLRKRGPYSSIRFKRKEEGKELFFETSTGLKDKRQAGIINDTIELALRTSDHTVIVNGEFRGIAARLFGIYVDKLLPGFSSALQGAGTEPPKERTLIQACELCDRSADVRSKDELYRQRLRQQFEKLMLKLGPDRPIRALNVSDIKEYRRRRMEEDGVISATANKDVSALSKVFRTLIEKGMTDKNPCRDVDRLDESDGEHDVYVSHRDFARIVEGDPAQATEGLPDWYKPMAWTAYYTGMRQGEIRNLELWQLDLKNRIISLTEGDTKEKGRKNVPIHRELGPILEGVLRNRVPVADTNNVFLRDGKPIPRTQMRRNWERAVREAGLPPITFHDTRHVWQGNATKDMPDEVRKSIIGHRWRKNGVDGRYLNKRKKLLIHCIDNKFNIDPEEETDIWLPRWQEKKRKKQLDKDSEPSSRTKGRFATPQGSKQDQEIWAEKSEQDGSGRQKKNPDSGSGFSKGGTKVVHSRDREERPKQ